MECCKVQMHVVAVFPHDKIENPLLRFHLLGVNIRNSHYRDYTSRDQTRIVGMKISIITMLFFVKQILLASVKVVNLGIPFDLVKTTHNVGRIICEDQGLLVIYNGFHHILKSQLANCKTHLQGNNPVTVRVKTLPILL